MSREIAAAIWRYVCPSNIYVYKHSRKTHVGTYANIKYAPANDLVPTGTVEHYTDGYEPHLDMRKNNARGLRFVVFCCSFANCIKVLHIRVTSWWARWRLKSPASRFFTQPLVQAQINEKMWKFRVTGFCQGTSPHVRPMTRKMFPFDDVNMKDTPLALQGCFTGVGILSSNW